MSLPTAAADRKAIPIATGFLDYFPKSAAAVAELSRIGNDQHNPGKPLHWDRTKSTDEADCLLRHFIQRGTIDIDGVRHSAKVAWRAMALLEKEIETEQARPIGRHPVLGAPYVEVNRTVGELDPYKRLAEAIAARAAHNADPTTRHGVYTKPVTSNLPPMQEQPTRWFYGVEFTAKR